MTLWQDFGMCMAFCAVLVLYMFGVRAWDRHFTRKFYKKLGQKPPGFWR